MRFRLLGVPVMVQTWFWITTAFLWFASRDALWTLPIWVAVVFVSILVHELGHAAAIMRHGIAPSITLHGMGGVTLWGGSRHIGRLDRAIISLAGPFAGFALGGLVYAATLLFPPSPGIVSHVVFELLWVNIGWGLINLAPVLPFDGGHVMEEVLGPRRARTAALVSLVASIALVVYFIFHEKSAWGAILFGMSAIQSWQLWRLPPGAVLIDPFTGGGSTRGPSASGGSGEAGSLRRWWLKLKLRRLQAQADAMRGEEPQRRRAGPDLRVIQGGRRDEPPKDKRWLN